MNILKSSEEVALKSVNINDRFWNRYIKLVKEVVIPYQWQAINDLVPDADESHAIKNFRIAAGLEQGEFYGYVFQDTDVYKWLEAVGYVLQIKPDEGLKKIADEVIDVIEKVQQLDGYLNTYFILKEPDKKWTNLAECHELYCAGHFIEAAVSYYKATQNEKVLNIACKLADCIANNFGFEDGKINGYDGHEEIELSLVKLYKLTDNEKYLTLSKFFLDERGKEPLFFDIEWEKRGKTSYWPNFRDWGRKYSQTHLPIREQRSAEGHAVRLVYLCTAMADVAMETNDYEILSACKNIWSNIVEKRMYITGGIGSMAYGEAFSFDYNLPNDTIYAETCASIGLAFFAYRMLQIEAKSCYADILERTLYNIIIASMSFDGKRFFYVNPLEVVPEACEKNASMYHVKPTRQRWFGCSCCPPNVTRMLASLGQYIYTSNKDAIYIHLYIGGEANINVGGDNIKLIQETEYPWKGKVLVRVFSSRDKQFTIGLRIPSWCPKVEIIVNGEKIDVKSIIRDGYALIKREWHLNDEIELKLDMPIVRVKANPKVRDNIGRVAIQRGPIIYCLEEEDNGRNLHEIIMPKEAELKYEFNNNLFGGIGIITVEAKRINETSFENVLYMTEAVLDYTRVELKFIPYYCWANRGIGEMMVWIKE